MSIKCFDGLPGLKAKVISLVNDKTSEKEAGIKVILEEHKKVHKELNDFRTLLGLPAEAYAAPDTSVEIDIIKEEYENKINAAKTGTQTTAAAPAANPKAQGQTTQGATPSSTAGTGKPNAAATAPVLTEKQKTIARLKAAREKNKKTIVDK